MGSVFARFTLGLQTNPKREGACCGHYSIDTNIMLLHTMHMKRTNLVLDESILKEAARVLGAKTYSAAVNQALEEIVNVRKIQNLQQFFGKDLWEGELSEMRQDVVPAADATPDNAQSANAAASGR